jgi:branched-chain amino acid transport system substrate-binding protein
MPFISRLSNLRRPSLLTRVGAPAVLLGLLALTACAGQGGASVASAPGVDAKTITLGAVLDTTGPIKVICQPILDGDQLYINKINAAGGINGRQVKLIQVSDSGDSTKTKDAVRQLIEQDNAFAIFQVCGSGNSNVAEAYLGPKGIPFIDPIGGGAQFKDASGKALPWLWMTQPNYGDEGHVIGYYATTTLKAKNVALLYEDDVLGLQQKTTLGEELTKNGATLVASVGYKATQADFSSAVQTLKAANPDLIVLNGLPGPTAKFILTAASQGYKPSIGYLANYPMSDNSWAKVLGSAGEGVYVSGYADVNTDIGKQYLAATTSDTTFSAYKFYGYIMSKLMLDALSKSGASPTRASLQTALNTDFNSYDTGFGPTITWSAQQHGGISDFEFLQIKNGTLTPVSGFIKASAVWP